MHRYTLINSFGSEPFTGNPVAVFFDCDNLETSSMQKLAAELNLSETTFICSPLKDGHARVRIFTPVNELSFAGHPLLGTALALAKESGVSAFAIETLKGTFRFSVNPVTADPFTAYVQMEQPSPIISPYENPDALLDALGVAQSTLPIEQYDVGPRHVFVGVANTTALSDIRPDYQKLSAFENMAALCFSPDGDNGWRMRMFSPAYGVTEDAATGSAAGPLALHLSRHGHARLGEKIMITQGVEIGKPSRMEATAHVKNNKAILKTGGYAIQRATGHYLL